MKIDVIKISEEDPTYLHLHYPTQTLPQPCYVELDLEEGTLTADVDGEIGAIPGAVCEDAYRRYDIPPLTAEAANALLDELAPLAQRMMDGMTVDQNDKYFPVSFSEDARTAEREIENRCNLAGDYPGDTLIQAYDAEDYFGGWTDKELGLAPDCNLDAIGAKLEAEHTYDSDFKAPLVIERLEQFLQYRYEKMMEEEND